MAICSSKCVCCPVSQRESYFVFSFSLSLCGSCWPALSQVVITVDGLAQLELDQNKWDEKDRRGKKQLTQG